SSVDRPDNGDGDNPEDLEEGELPDDEGDGDDGSGEGTGDGTPDSPTPPPPRSEEDTGGEVLEETDIDVDANFQYSPDGPYVVGQTVRFVDTSAGAPTSWTWNFGDGTAQGPDVTHAWDTPGQWPVTLTVSNGSVSDEISTLVTVTDPDVAQPPTADFTFSTRSPRVGDPVRFTDRSTNDPTAWSWDFGDGTTGAGPQVSHTWSEPGPKTIVLTASNDEGQDTAQVQIIVVDRIEPPVAEIEIDRTTLKTGEDVRLTDASSGNPTDVIWRFGDGTQRRAAPGATISHQWSQAEDYEVELIVSNDAGDDTASVVVTVEPAIDPPTVEISGDDTVEVGRPLGLNAITTNNPTRIEWDFGDDTAANGASVSKTWDEIGDYVVNVEVENEAGVDDTDIVVTVTPKVLPPLEADFERNPRRADVGQEVQFTDRSSGAIVSWQWDFDDGGTSSDPNPTHVFDEPGVYSVRLVVTDENGETDPQRRNVRVEGGRAPEANFQFRPGEPRAGQEVQFTSTSEGDINRYRWQFGDGGTARGANPVHVFESGNDYEVTLTVRNPSGESSSTRVVRVTPELRDPPEAAFVVETAGPLVAGQPITFRDTTPGQVGTPQWTFPTGQRLPDQPGARTITYRFEGPGEFPVSMEVCWADDAQNCSRATRQVSVQAPAEPPVASFEIVGDGVLSQDQIIANRPVTFRSTATGGGIDDYTWTINGRTFDGAEVRDVVVSGATEIVVAHTASNDAGPSAPAQRRITVVTAEPPVARFEAPGQAAVGEPVQFTDTSTGAPIRWRWNFGDNTPEVIEQSPVHTFNTPGNYQVTLVAENDWGASQPVTRNIQIQDAPEPPVSQPEVQLADGTVIPQGSPVPIGTEVLLVNNSTSPNIAYVEWELLPFDLGNVQVAPGQAYPTQALGFPGERTVRSRVVTTDGQTSPWVPYTVVLTLG
ncbi:MAG: PKD domain-containing protein, partial [Actinomycetota bacterium]|nr:PKD domain-containing protein [Actinomycetota bacterium]